MERKRGERYSKEFRRQAVDRMNVCDNISRLCRELGIARHLLYGWRDRLEQTTDPPTGRSREVILRKQGLALNDFSSISLVSRVGCMSKGWSAFASFVTARCISWRVVSQRSHVCPSEVTSLCQTIGRDFMFRLFRDAQYQFLVVIQSPFSFVIFLIPFNQRDD